MNNPKFRAVIALLTLSFAIFVGWHFSSEPTQVETVKEMRTIVIESRLMSAVEAKLAPFKPFDAFISEPITSDFEFTSLGGQWEQYAPEGTGVEVYIKFFNDEKWGEWTRVEPEDDHDQLHLDDKHSISKYAFISTDEATAFQYKFVLYGDGERTAQVKNPEWTFLKTADSKRKAIRKERTLNSGNVSVISRSSWGANESLRYPSTNAETSKESCSSGCDSAEKDSSNSAYALVVNEDSSGKEYLWPLQYANSVDRFIIHHTATTKNLSNPKQAIRDIYYYHAVSRGWGDIGYNYIVDQEGNIYEGRFGGEGVVGGHALGANNGTIGIAVLGNYQENEVPEKVMSSLATLIAEKAKIHNIVPSSTTIIGHRHVASTACPGIFLVENLKLLQESAKNAMGISNRTSTLDYDFVNTAGSKYIVLEPSSETSVTLTLKNIGKNRWNSGTALTATNSASLKGIVTISDGKMSGSRVDSKGEGTFKIVIKSGNEPGLYYPELKLKADGQHTSTTAITLPVIIKSSSSGFELVSADLPPKTMKQGEMFIGSVKIMNTGNTTWYKTGKNQVTLRTIKPNDHKSEFLKNPSATISYLKEREVRPGQTGTFTLNLQAPKTSGTYKENFTPYVEGLGYLEDEEISFSVNVHSGGTVEGSKGAEVLKVYAASQWRQNRSYSVTIKIVNQTKKTWNQENFKAEILGETDLAIRDVKLKPETVAPGEVGSLSFIAKPAKDDELGKKTVQVKPLVDGERIFTLPIKVNYEVVSLATANNSTTKTSSSNTTTDSSTTNNTSTINNSGPVALKNVNIGNMRVKLGFSGNPEITGNGGFKVVSGDKTLGNFKSGEVISVRKRGTDYAVDINGKTSLVSKPVRFIPENGTILKISNYQNVPAWNKDLNDNMYLGTLEVNTEDSKPIVINELPLEDYLQGLGEVSNNEHPEKIKAIMVAARSYAVFYMIGNEKFPGKPYNLDDSPERSQKYLGYGLTTRSPNVVAGVLATAGEVVSFNGKVVKTPYFNQSDGGYTKSAYEVWGWTDTPYLVAVKDDYCSGDKFLGHGVGMSGCGSKGMAENGSGYEEILEYYYKGAVLSKI